MQSGRLIQPHFGAQPEILLQATRLQTCAAGLTVLENSYVKWLQVYADVWDISPPEGSFCCQT